MMQRALAISTKRWSIARQSAISSLPGANMLEIASAAANS